MNVTFETGGDGSIATTHDWLTPLWVLRPLGDFDLDPCASQTQPWKTAETQFTIKDDGLSREWHGRVWCNPPYGDKAEKFLKRMSEHGDGIVLIFARTETKAFQKYCFGCADGMLFLNKRVQFCLPDGTLPKKGGAGAPSVLIAYGQSNVQALRDSKLGGYIVDLKNKPVKPMSDLFSEIAT
jgi:hypothetical protein